MQALASRQSADRRSKSATEIVGGAGMPLLTLTNHGVSGAPCPSRSSSAKSALRSRPLLSACSLSSITALTPLNAATTRSLSAFVATASPVTTAAAHAMTAVRSRRLLVQRAKEECHHGNRNDCHAEVLEEDREVWDAVEGLLLPSRGEAECPDPHRR